MPRDVKQKRSYESPRRRAQAEATRRDILAAAQRLFERHGYPATTMAQVAREAGVSLKTVYLAFGTKPGLLRSLWNIQTEYHANQRAIVEPLDRQNRLRAGIGVDRAADILWTTNHPNTWQLLVVERGWTPEQYEQWAGGDLACAQFLA
jgi:AcrR family transcriptional regulator